MLTSLLHFLRSVVLWAIVVGILWSGSLQTWEMQISGLISNDAVAIEQAADDQSVSPCNGQCVVDSILCNSNACVDAYPSKIALVRKALSVDWPIPDLALTGRAITIEPEPPKYA